MQLYCPLWQLWQVSIAGAYLLLGEAGGPIINKCDILKHRSGDPGNFDQFALTARTFSETGVNIIKSCHLWSMAVLKVTLMCRSPQGVAVRRNGRKRPFWTPDASSRPSKRRPARFRALGLRPRARKSTRSIYLTPFLV